MTSDHDIIEAKLFYSADADVDFANLAEDLIRAFAKTNIKIRSRLASNYSPPGIFESNWGLRPEFG